MTQPSTIKRKRSAATSQQERAIGTRGVSVVLSSGAGCGKTSVLTARYLSHLERGEADPSRLVAITFTDKAAREMRQRIRQAVEDRLATSSETDRTGWRDYLRGLETASISTIHSFCTSLLRQHALVAGLDPYFGVAEPPVAGIMRAEAVRDTLTDLITNAKVEGESLRALVRTYGWHSAREAIVELLKSPDSTWKEWIRSSPNLVMAQWLDRSKTDLLPGYVDHLVISSGPIAETLRLLRRTPCIGPKMAERVQRVIALTPQLATALDLGKAIKQLIEVAKVQGTEAANAWQDTHTYEQIKDSLDAFRKSLGLNFEPFLEPTDGILLAAEVGQHFIRVALACQTRFAQAKSAASLLDFQDQLVAARDLLRDHAGVRAEVRRRYQFLLVDELQDTDAVQMELAELICGSGLTCGKLFAVGDTKQSIYRFRGAVVELFEGLRDRVPDAGRQTLTDNFRSQREILLFTNALLSESMPKYEPLTNGLPPVGTNPCVEFLWTRRPKGDDIEAGRRAEADQIAHRIVAMIGRESLVTERPEGKTPSLRPVKAGDIVLLFRAMTNVSIYESALREHGLDYYLVGGRAFFAQQEVYDLYQLLRVLENPHDALSLAGALRSPFGCVSDEGLLVLATNARGMWTGLHDDATCNNLSEPDHVAVERIRGWLDNWRQLKDRLRLPDLLARIIADSGYDAALQFESLGTRKLANLWKLIELARTFSSNGRFGLHHFINQLGELMKAQPLEEQAATQPEESNVVRLMSIHQAKGLEFPVVILPDLAAQQRGPSTNAAIWGARLGCVPRPPSEDTPPLFSNLPRKLWQVQEAIDGWHDDLRTLYVACTRAQDYLILSGSLSEKETNKNTAMTVLAERYDLQSGECLDASIPAEERPKINIGQLPQVLLPESNQKNDQNGMPLNSADAEAIQPIPPDANRGIIDLEPREWSATATQRDRIRRVLAEWDLRDVSGWRGPLAALENTSPGGLRGPFAAGFARFVKSPLFAKLQAANELHSAVEFAFAPEKGPVGRGVIDFLWRDDRGWHVAAIKLDSEIDVSMIAAAMTRHAGTAPASIGVYDWATGSFT